MSSKPVQMKMAESLATARRDEFVYLDRHGNVRPSWHYRFWDRAAMPLIGTVTAGGVWLGLAMGMPMVAGGYALFGVWSYLRARTSGRLARAMTLTVHGHYDEAEVLLEGLCKGNFTTRRVRGLAKHNRGHIAFCRGDVEKALIWTRAAKPDLSRGRPIWRSLEALQEVNILARMGLVDEAKARLDEARVVAGEQESEYWHYQARTSILLVAFYSQDASSLPEELFEWARTGLETTSADLFLVLLAWAYEQREDADMSRHLLAEAWDRLDSELIQRMFPEVHEWGAQRQEAARAARDEQLMLNP